MSAALEQVEYVNTVGIPARRGLTCASLFGGGGGWEVGARAAGLTPVWTVELDAEIAAVHRANFPESRVIVADARELDPSALEPADVLFASPPCQAHSVARSKRLAPREDADAGLCVIEYLRVLRPRRFFMENVEGYKRSRTYKAIINALHALGYWTDAQVLNAADFGVPQTRRRLIVRASLDGFPAPLPRPVKWTGWYEAIEDLIDTLPESKFAPWQSKRLGVPGESALVTNQHAQDTTVAEPKPRTFAVEEPAGVIIAESCSRTRAFICDGKTGSHGTCVTVRPGDAPMFGVVTSLGNRQAARAFIAGVQGEGDDLRREEKEPAPTVTSAHGAAKVRAFVVEGSVAGDRPPTVRGEGEPLFTYTANNGTQRSNATRAFIAHPTADNDRFVVRTADEPTYTLTNTHNPHRSMLGGGRVVAMTPRALARFQSFPDSYVLPEKTALASKVIGNAVCPLLSRRLIEAELPVLIDRAAREPRDDDSTTDRISSSLHESLSPTP